VPQIQNLYFCEYRRVLEDFSEIYTLFVLANLVGGDKLNHSIKN